MAHEKMDMEYDLERIERITLAAEFRRTTSPGHLAEEAAGAYALARRAAGEGRQDEAAELYIEAGRTASLAVMAHLIESGAIELPTE